MTLEPVRAHPWDVSPERARRIQCNLGEHVIIEPLRPSPEVVAGVDVSVRDGRSRAAVVILALPDLQPLEAVTATRPTEFPYVPGLLAFREGPVTLDALEKLSSSPDILIFDAHGYAHPLHFGLATHLGVLLDKPSVGCAKSRLCGHYEEPEEHRGSWSPLYGGAERERDEVIGAVVRTRDGVNPVFVSVGHRVDLESAIALVLTCARPYRLPETTRWAHRVAGGKALPGHEPPEEG